MSEGETNANNAPQGRDQSTPQGHRFEIGSRESLPLNVPRFFQFGRHSFGVVRVAGPERVIAFDDACPHAGANLAEGAIEDGWLVCPWHSWAFSLETGRCQHRPTVSVPLYTTEIDEQDKVIVYVPDRPASNEDQLLA